MMENPYSGVLEGDIEDYRSCEFNWDCENCTKHLCLTLVSAAHLPSIYGDFWIIGFANNKDHIAVVKGDVKSKENVLTRLHSKCLTGDSLGSLRCDCGPQLHKALQLIEEEGLGVVLYMQQEGRGIGLVNKIKAYRLQDMGLDTLDANLHLGFEPDERDYEISAAMLDKLEVKSVRLLTNNPEKVEQLRRFGVDIVERVPHEVPPQEHDRLYLETKKERFGHKLRLDG